MLACRWEEGYKIKIMFFLPQIYTTNLTKSNLKNINYEDKILLFDLAWEYKWTSHRSLVTNYQYHEYVWTTLITRSQHQEHWCHISYSKSKMNSNYYHIGYFQTHTYCKPVIFDYNITMLCNWCNFLLQKLTKMAHFYFSAN